MSLRRESSPPPAPGPSRDPSARNPNVLQHVPLNPSGLRESHSFASSSPEDSQSLSEHQENSRRNSAGPPPHLHSEYLEENGHTAATETTALLRKPFEHSESSDHGTISPRITSRAGSIRSGYGFGGGPPNDYDGNRDSRGPPSSIGSFLEVVGVGYRSGGKRKVSTTNWLAEQHGITNTTSMYT
jgi:hypothetical protein